nr:MAG TPA: hypothetical protein [Caudoviricetes sp.]
MTINILLSLCGRLRNRPQSESKGDESYLERRL